MAIFLFCDFFWNLAENTSPPSLAFRNFVAAAALPEGLTSPIK